VVSCVLNLGERYDDFSGIMISGKLIEGLPTLLIGIEKFPVDPFRFYFLVVGYRDNPVVIHNGHSDRIAIIYLCLS